MIFSIRNIIWIVIACSVLYADVLRAQWYAVYDDALKAIKKQQWEEAIRLLNITITIKNKPKAIAATYDSRHYIDYFPYLYRGIANYHSDQFYLAQQDLNRSKSFGEVNKATRDRDAKNSLQHYLALLEQLERTQDTFNQAISLFKEQKYQEAIEKFNVVLNLQPNHSEAKKYIKRAESQLAVEKKYNEGIAFFNQKDYETAINRFEEIKKQNPEYPKVDDYINRAQNALDKITRDEARGLAARERSQKIGQLMGGGVNLFNQNKLDEAEIKFSNVLKLAANHSEAINYLDKIKQRSQENIDKVFRSAVDLYNQNKWDEARDEFRRVLQLAGNHGKSVNYLKIIKERLDRDLKQTSSPASDLERSVRAGIIAFFQGNYDQAINQLEQATRDDNDTAHVHAFLACAYATQYFLQNEKEKKLYNLAITKFQKALELNPDYGLDDKFISPRIIAMFNEKMSLK